VDPGADRTSARGAISATERAALMNGILTEDDAAELRRHRARARRNATRRARRAAAKGSDYMGMSTRVAAHAPLYAEQGTVSLADLDYVAKVHARVLEQAVIRLIENEGYSWTMVGVELGVGRTAAQKRFGHLVKSRRTRGGQPADLR
jgi:hypothetical protein